MNQVTSGRFRSPKYSEASAAIRRHRADPIGIRIGRQDQVGVVLAHHAFGPVQGFWHFGIRRFGNVRKLSIRRGLHGNGDRPKTLSGENFAGVRTTDTVQRCKDQREFIESRWRNETLFLAKLDVGPVRLLIQKVDLAGTNSIGEWDQFYRRHLFDNVGHDLIVGRDRLRTALVGKLGAIVVRRIV